jgi:hypothetical protein
LNIKLLRECILPPAAASPRRHRAPSMQAKLARLVAPAVCLGYVGYVLVDRFAYHEARKLELIEETRRAKEEAARRVAARPEG